MGSDWKKGKRTGRHVRRHFSSLSPLPAGTVQQVPGARTPRKRRGGGPHGPSPRRLMRRRAQGILFFYIREGRDGGEILWLTSRGRLQCDTWRSSAAISRNCHRWLASKCGRRVKFGASTSPTLSPTSTRDFSKSIKNFK